MTVGTSVRSFVTSLALSVSVLFGLGMGSAALISSASAAPPSSPQPSAAQRIVAKSLEEFTQVAQRTCDDLQDGARRASRAIHRAAENSATDEELAALADQAKMRLMNRAQAGIDRINLIKSNALAALANHNGTQEQIDRVNAAAQRAIDRINQCIARAKARIDTAVDNATGDSSGPD